MQKRDDKLPPWEPRNAKEIAQFTEWTLARVFDVLDREFEENQRASASMPWEEVAAARRQEALAEAGRGNVLPLRDLVRGSDPELAEFINLPDRRRGQRFYPRNRSRDSLVRLACRCVPVIREVWFKHYGKKNRGRDQHPSAVAIAAELAGVDNDEITEMKKRGGAPR